MTHRRTSKKAIGFPAFQSLVVLILLFPGYKFSTPDLTAENSLRIHENTCNLLSHGSIKINRPWPRVHPHHPIALRGSEYSRKKKKENSVRPLCVGSALYSRVPGAHSTRDRLILPFGEHRKMTNNTVTS